MDDDGNDQDQPPQHGLEDDALEHVFKALNCADLSHCSCVSRAWRDVAGRDALWLGQLPREMHRPPRLPPPRAARRAAAAGAGRAVFDYCMAEPALRHRAWQARFHSAMAQLGPWRALVILRAAPAPAAPEAPAAGRTAEPVARAWVCRAVGLQHHEQSAWVRFPLPPALAEDAGVVAGCQEGRLEVRVEAMAPGGAWLPLIVSSPFRLHLADDRAMLLQSHREGLYAWDADEGGGGGAGGAGGVPQHAPEGPQQQGQQPPAGGPQPANAGRELPAWFELAAPFAAALASAGAGGSNGSTPAGVAAPECGPLERSAQVAPAAAAAAGAVAEEGVAAPPARDLRMVAYVHYEQLLPAVQGRLALPQAFPLVPRAAPPPSTPPAADGAASEPPGSGRPPEPPMLLLQLDFCRLRGSQGLGRVTARLRRRRWGVAAVQFEALLEGDVDVVAYGGAGEEGGGGAGDGGAGQGGSGELLEWGPGEEDGSDSGDSGGGADGEDAGGAPDGEAQQSQVSDPSAADGDGGGGAARAAVAGAAGRELLESMVSGDEVMADLALFDDTGRLLLGRAGVEMWQKEGTSLLPAANGAGGADVVAVHRQLHLLHFLVDGLGDEELWDCCLTLDPAPEHQGGGRITLRLSWRALVGLHPQPGIAAGDGGG